MSDPDDKKERARQRRIETARDLEARGHVEHAVKEFLRAKAPEEAARLLASKGRLRDAAQALLDGLKVQPAEVGGLDAAGRQLATQAAVFFEQGNDSGAADTIRAALAAAPPPSAPSPAPADAPSPPSPTGPPSGSGSRPSPSIPSSGSASRPSPSIPSSGSPSRPSPSASSSGSVSRPSPSRAPSAGSGGFRAPSTSSGGFRAPSTSSGSFRAPTVSGGSFRPPRPSSGSFRPPASSSVPPITVRRPAPAGGADASPSRPAAADAPEVVGGAASDTAAPESAAPGRPVVKSGSFRPPTESTAASAAPERPPVSSGSFRPPGEATAASAAPERPRVSSGSFHPPKEASAAAAAPERPRVSSGSFRPPADAKAAGAAPPHRAAIAPPADPPSGGQRLSASGDVVSEYAGSREAGWRDADGATIDRSIEEHLAAGRKGAAARIARDAGRFEQALEWFRELDLHMQAGACLRALGRLDLALAELLREDAGGPNYRKACFELVPIAVELGRIDFDIDRFLTRFVEEGPKDRDEIATYLELAKLYVRADFLRGARRCVAKILDSDKHHAEAKALRAELERGSAPAPRSISSAPATARGLPALPSLEEFVKLAREHALRD